VVLAERPIAFGHSPQLKAATEAPQKVMPLAAQSITQTGTPSASAQSIKRTGTLPASAQSIPQTSTLPASAQSSSAMTVSDAASNPGLLSLKDENDNEVKPSAVLAAGNDLLFLSPKCLWICRQGLTNLASGADLTLTKIDPPKSFGSLKIQEFNNFAACPARNSIIVLDKSGDLYEYSPSTNKWQLFRSNLPFLKGQPDPEFIDLGISGASVTLLDPERNQIWQTNGNAPRMSGFLRDVLPWRLKPGDTYVGDGLSMSGDDSAMFVLKKFGNIAKFSTASGVPGKHQMPFKYTRVPGMRPSRILTGPALPLFIVERENNRVLVVDKTTGRSSQFLFAKNSDLRGLLPFNDGFWVLNGGRLQQRKLAQPDSLKVAFKRHSHDERLDGMIIPVKGVALPRHVGVFPGARRLYRFGIHEGMDFFLDPGSRTKVAMNTPVRAADGGKVLRSDINFKDMTYAQFNKVMNDCYREHRTSDHNEDLFRGCQVWISHGNGLITRYAHLNKVNPEVKKDQQVSRGDLIGFVGVSGTGQNLPGRTKYPHLHFEIWLDGKYLGWGLTPAETMGVYEDIFGNGVGE
jgi:murein DD-endopeptidase MepM/ murein hydrolase activator NlpD